MLNNNNHLHIACWNVKGLCGQDLEAKHLITYRLGANIYFYSETWATTDPINLEGYVCINTCRKVQHIRASRPGGGLAFLLREPLTDVYNIQAVNNDMDEVLHVKLTDKQSGFAISLFGLYIPPETSSFGQGADQISL